MWRFECCEKKRCIFLLSRPLRERLGGDDDGRVIKVNGDGVINNLGVVYLLNRWLQEEGDYDEQVSALLEMEA